MNKIPSANETPPGLRRNQFIAAFTLVLFLCVILGAYALIQARLHQVAEKQSTVESNRLISSTVPSPMPFYEMTIPYLRARSYSSSLGDRSPVSHNTSYTSYQVPYDSDGLSIIGLLTIPTGSPPSSGWPGVVFIHGYIPPSSYDTLASYASYVDYLARQGIVVYKIDLRGHADSEGEARGGYYSEGYVIDALNAYEALLTLDEVDKSNISLWGHSMAGNIVARGVAALPTIPKAVIWAGAVYTYEDMQEYGISDNSYRPPSEDSQRKRYREDLFNTYGPFSADSDFWKQVVPVNYLDKSTTKFQIHHAIDDPVVSIDYSRNLDKILREKGIVHELFEYPSGGHNITGTSFSEAMKRSADFIINK